MNPIPIRNVYNMLVYAFEMLNSTAYKRLDMEQCEDIHDLLASLLLCGTHSLIKHGFLRSYVRQSEEISAIRGKIDISKSVQKLSLQNAKAVCNYDEFSNNIHFNQIIKTTFLHLKRQALQTHIKHDISRVLMYFNEIDAVNVSEIQWGRFVFNRNNARYNDLLYFCRLICEEAIANQAVGNNAFKLLDEDFLPLLFERFVFAFYRKTCESYNVLFQQSIKWNASEVGFDKPPKMNADIIIENNHQKLIIDTKFYSKTLQRHPSSNNHTVRSNNLYQIFAYVKNESAGTIDKSVSGMLLYPQIDVKLRKHFLIHGHHFYAVTVDLNQKFELIKEELIDIVDKAMGGKYLNTI